jgi:protein Mpv17
MFAARTWWAWYRTQLEMRPLLTKATTTSALMSLSDAVCQYYEISMVEKGSDVILTPRMSSSVFYAATTDNHEHTPLAFDWQRTLNVGITGFVWTGPLSHSWYSVLESTVRARTRLGGIGVRLILDATIFSPIAVAGYFVFRSFLEGNSIGETQQRLQSKFTDALTASWQFWPIANVLNFAFVPAQFRVLYNNSLSLLWNGYLSHLNGTTPELSLLERESLIA